MSPPRENELPEGATADLLETEVQGENIGLQSPLQNANHVQEKLQIHPMELTVQSLIESPLEILHLNLQSLYESQMILSHTLKKLQDKLLDTDKILNGASQHLDEDETKNDFKQSKLNHRRALSSATVRSNSEQSNGQNQENISRALLVVYKDTVKEYTDKINATKLKLQKINTILSKVEQRVDKMVANLGIDDDNGDLGEYNDNDI